MIRAWPRSQLRVGHAHHRLDRRPGGRRHCCLRHRRHDGDSAHGQQQSSRSSLGRAAIRGGIRALASDGTFPADANGGAHDPRQEPQTVQSVIGTRPAATRAAFHPRRLPQQALINQDRARYHLAPLTWNSCLYNVARYEAAHLAAPGVAFQHYDGVNRDLACHLGRQVGENIGWWSGGINDAQLNTMFMNSPEHRSNILGPYRYAGMAWAVRSDGRAFIAVEFG